MFFNCMGSSLGLTHQSKQKQAYILFRIILDNFSTCQAFRVKPFGLYLEWYKSNTVIMVSI